MDYQFIKSLVPPLGIKLLRTYSPIAFGPRWAGSYQSWNEALTKCAGYDSEEIITKVRDALLKVKNHEAVHERDSVLFDEIQYSWPVLAGLLWVYARSGKLNLIDFGGSLGSTYYQNRKFIQPLESVSWNIVEQRKMVEIGKADFEDGRLKFYYDIESCLLEHSVNCLLLSSVLSYIEDPYGLLEKLTTWRFRFLVLDKLPVIAGPDRLTIQKTPASIYRASYPAWFFSEEKITQLLAEHYSLVERFDCPDEANIESRFIGMIWELK